MEILGRIITDSKKISPLDFIEITNEFDGDVTIPTLVVGWKKINEIFDNVNILKKEIMPNIFWTFSRTERRYEFEDDIELFYKFVFNKVNKEIKYTFFNIFTSPLSKIKLFLKYIKNNKRKFITISNDMVYIVDGNKVVGLSLLDIEYLNINKIKILNLIKNNKNNIINYKNFLYSINIENKYNSILNSYLFKVGKS